MLRKYEICATLVDLIVFLSLQFFRLCGYDLCITRKWGKKVFRVQLDGMEACNKIAVKWMVLWELAHV
jgi:hypothetical protein